MSNIRFSSDKNISLLFDLMWTSFHGSLKKKPSKQKNLLVHGGKGFGICQNFLGFLLSELGHGDEVIS